MDRVYALLLIHMRPYWRALAPNGQPKPFICALWRTSVHPAHFLINKSSDKIREGNLWLLRGSIALALPMHCHLAHPSPDRFVSSGAEEHAGDGSPCPGERRADDARTAHRTCTAASCQRATAPAGLQLTYWDVGSAHTRHADRYA